MFDQIFTKVANTVALAAGKPVTFILCVAIVVIWAFSGPIFGFSDTWQLIINTGTTIVTFLMVFLIQNTQNRDSVAIQAKLDELVRVSNGKNAFIGIEHLTEAEVEKFRKQCEEAAKKADEELKSRTAAKKKSKAAPREAARKPPRAKAHA
ncbi:low affinity iron permease family protein [Phyllobacterium sp. CCNWLW109]|uniref:low affinity iron permease family protein n=1 Tax=unclassified Phyllobacterium TaxID=2638441 RepID=UPI0030775E5F